MEKLIYLFLVIVFVIAGCKDKKQVVFTEIGIITPYQINIEKLGGRVEKVTEANYCAVLDRSENQQWLKLMFVDRDTYQMSLQMGNDHLQKFRRFIWNNAHD